METKCGRLLNSDVVLQKQCQVHCDTIPNGLPGGNRVKPITADVVRLVEARITEIRAAAVFSVGRAQAERLTEDANRDVMRLVPFGVEADPVSESQGLEIAQNGRGGKKHKGTILYADGSGAAAAGQSDNDSSHGLRLRADEFTTAAPGAGAANRRHPAGDRTRPRPAFRHLWA